MKRDDLTGVELSGNKVRKLEYLLGDAKNKKAEYIFTCGGEQSNHARATVFAAAQLGFKSRIFLWGRERKSAEGNLFMNKFLNTEIVYLDKKQYWNVSDIMAAEKRKLEKKRIKVYTIPEGGSSALGIWGYIDFANELKKQADLKSFNAVLTAAGSGGTAAGLLIGLKLLGINKKIFAVNVLYSKHQIEEKIVNLVEDCLKKFNIKKKINLNDLEILDGYSLEGYKNIDKEKIDLIREFARSTGIILDPAYTGKAFFAFNKLFLKGKKNCTVLFLHSGGLFGVFAKRDKYLGI